jgi:hypothetical protein
MAAANYLATRAEREETLHTEAVEQRHIEKAAKGERLEVSEILKGLGILSDLLDRMVSAVTPAAIASSHDAPLRIRIGSRGAFALAGG